MSFSLDSDFITIQTSFKKVIISGLTSVQIGNPGSNCKYTIYTYISLLEHLSFTENKLWIVGNLYTAL